MSAMDRLEKDELTGAVGDESKPTCEGCQSRSERCEWGVKVSFRPGMSVYCDPQQSALS
jgi:hypothetical protein